MFLHVFEIIFVQNHAVVLKAKTPFKLAKRRRLCRVERSGADEVGDALVKDIGVSDVALVELKMHCERFVRNARQVAQVK